MESAADHPHLSHDGSGSSARRERALADLTHVRLRMVESRAAGFWFQRTFPSSSERSVSWTYRAGTSALRPLGNGFLLVARKA